MAEINLTDDEGYNPNESYDWVQYPSKNDTRCDVCWRYLFKGDMIKQRKVNGVIWRAVYCPNAKKEIMHLNTSKEYLMHLQLAYNVLDSDRQLDHQLYHHTHCT